MFNDFLTKTATVKRLNTTTKTKRTYTTVSATFMVSEPQLKNELDLVQGQHITRYILYTDYDSTIVKGDTLTVDSLDYVVLASEPHKVRNIEFRKLITDRDTQ